MALTTNSNHTVLRGGGQGGHLYTGVEPIVVNNQEYKISANTAALGVESPLYFSVDTPTQTVISFSGDGQPYSAGENISVENHIISGKDWTPELDEKLDISALENLDVTEYSAGDNINISNHIISGKDWNPEINNASSYAYSEAIARIHETEYSAGPNINIIDHIVSGKDWTDEINSASANAVEEAKIQITAVASATMADSAYTANYALSSDSATYDSNGNIITATYLTAVTGDNTPYSAGANIDITDHIVSGKDWTSDIQAASANAASAGSAAATAWTDQQNYLTAHQDVTDLPYVQNSALDYTPGGHLVSSISGDGLYAMSAEGAFTAETANYSYVAETANYVANGWEYNASNEITGYSGSAIHSEATSEGKIYTGISPIVVDNSTTTGTISAQTARLGVQGPLYFVEDTSASTVIGISGLPEVEGLMYESALNFGDGYITGYNSSALSSERSRYAVSSTSANGAVSSQTAAIVTGGWETANGKITGYNGTAFNAGAGNTYDVKASSNISVSTAGNTFTVSGKDWTNTITAASSYAYNQATAGGQGRAYTGIYPIEVNNTENKISAYTIPLYAGNYLSMSTASTGVTLNVTGMNKTNWDSAYNYLANTNVANGRYTAYDSYNNPNWWTGNNIFGFKLNSASVFNSTGIAIEAARIDGLERERSGSNSWILDINILFSKFIPINTATWNIVTTSFFTITSGHFVAPVYSEMWTNWGAAFGAVMIDNNALWTTAVKLSKFEPWSGYTGDKVFVNFRVPWVGG